MTSLATIGYEGTTVELFLGALAGQGIDLLVDVRAVASSRKPGFAKTKLAANLSDVGIGYLHLRGLGTPADGRAAARRGRHEEMKARYAAHLQSATAQQDLEVLALLVNGPRQVCIFCLEAKPEHCHRSLVAAELARTAEIEVVHLRPTAAGPE